MRAALAGLDGVTSVEHEAGTDVFIVKHNGPLSDAAQTVDCVVIFKWARAGEAAAGSPKGTRSELHITLVTIGSRGDIQPYIALGQGRQPRGLAVNDQSIRQRAAPIGELIRNAAGAQRVVEIYQRYSA